MRRRTILIGAFLFALLAVAFVYYAVAILPGHLVRAHQQSVTSELTKWQREYSNIRSIDDAIRTAEMMDYVKTYYVVSDGYRSTPDVEAALEKQRQDTISAFVDALRTSTGENYGSDSSQWLAHLRSNKARITID